MHVVFISFILVTSVTTAECTWMHDHHCIPNAYFGTLFVKSLSDCRKECLRRPRCDGINYKHNHHYCELLDFSAIGGWNAISDWLKECKGYVFSTRLHWLEASSQPASCSTSGPGYERWDEDTGSCTVTECGPPLSLPNADLYGNRWSVGSRVQYRCQADQTERQQSTCLSSGQWSPIVSCSVADTVGKNCSVSRDDCPVANSKCVPRDLDPAINNDIGICMCEHWFRYNAVERTCIRVCTYLANTFFVVHGKQIKKYNIAYDYTITKEDCEAYCVTLYEDKCMSYEFALIPGGDSGACSWNYVNDLQIRQIDPDQLVDKSGYNVYVRNCFI